MATNARSMRAISSGRPDPERETDAGAVTLTMTAANGGTINSGDATTDLVITANRTRIAEIVTDVAAIDARVDAIVAACQRIGLLD